MKGGTMFIMTVAYYLTAIAVSVVHAQQTQRKS